MTAAELHAWVKRRRLSHEEAAKELGLSIDGLRNNLYGRRPVGTQTARIVQLSDRLASLQGVGTYSHKLAEVVAREQR